MVSPASSMHCPERHIMALVPCCRGCGLWSSTLAAHGCHDRDLLRCVCKKQNRITQMDEAAAVRQRLNQEQKEVMRSKPSFTAIIGELKRLHARRSPCFRRERLPPRRAPDGAMRAKLDRIMASDYYTSDAVGGSYGAEGVQAQESINYLTRGTFYRGEPGC